MRAPIISTAILFVGVLTIHMAQAQTQTQPPATPSPTSQPATDANLPPPQPEVPVPSPHFKITKFNVTGNTLMKAEDIDKLVAPYTGDDKDFSDIQRALEAIEGAYRKQGLGAAEVVIPEQDITGGVVKLQVVEPVINKINVEGNKHFSADNVRRSLPALQEGQLPKLKEVARELDMIEEHPVKRATVLLKTADQGKVDANVKVTDDKPLKVFLSADNTGNESTGEVRTAVGLQDSNLTDHDDVLTAQYMTSPGHWSDVKIAGASYHLPFYKVYGSLDVMVGYADVNSGVLQDLFTVSGSGTTVGVRYNFNLPKIGEYSHKFSIGQDYRSYNNEVQYQGVNLVPDIRVHPTSLTYSGDKRMDGADLTFYLTYARNLWVGGVNGSQADFTAARTGATAHYDLWRAGFNYLQLLPKQWQTRLAFNGQYTNDALVSGEQFGFGGMNSVRGFHEREVANDSGFTANAELYTPDVGPVLPALRNADFHLRWLVFCDYGYAHRNDAQPGEELVERGTSAGIGLRLGWTSHFSLRADLGHVLQGAGTQERGDNRANVYGILVF